MPDFTQRDTLHAIARVKDHERILAEQIKALTDLMVKFYDLQSRITALESRAKHGNRQRQAT
jgi:hypothetical protein